MKKILTVIGARPQFIKAAPLSKALAAAGISEVLVHTGQHYDHNMSAVFFEELELPVPHANLGVGSGSHAQQTAQIMSRLDEYLDTWDTPPACAVVFGDTNSTLAAALTAAKRHIPVAHVEAGLRSFNRTMPEETNRVLTDHLSDLLFCPDEAAAQQLAKEGIRDNVHVVGDLMLDVQQAVLAQLDHTKAAQYLAQWHLAPRRYVLATVHRAENTDHPDHLKGILDGFGQYDGTIALVLHPRTAKALEQHQITCPPNVICLPPLGYRAMLVLAKNALKIATDSGGLQKEAYWLGIPCVTLRAETEWAETVAQGGNQLVGHHAEYIAEALGQPTQLKNVLPLYGDGTAARQIAQQIRIK